MDAEKRKKKQEENEIKKKLNEEDKDKSVVKATSKKPMKNIRTFE